MLRLPVDGLPCSNLADAKTPLEILRGDRRENKQPATSFHANGHLLDEVICGHFSLGRGDLPPFFFTVDEIMGLDQ